MVAFMAGFSLVVLDLFSISFFRHIVKEIPGAIVAPWQKKTKDQT
jgi:hypothetical protein